MDKLYEEYGRLLIQREILDTRINSVKQKIVAELNKEKIKKPDEGKING